MYASYGSVIICVGVHYCYQAKAYNANFHIYTLVGSGHASGVMLISGFVVCNIIIVDPSYELGR